MAIARIGVIGGGAWGTALAVAAERAGRPAVLWARETETVRAIARDRANPRYLPGIALDPGPGATTDLAEAAACDAVLLVVPAQFLRGVCRTLAPLLPGGTPVVVCAKGIELGTGALMTEVVTAELPRNPVAVLSGPTFAAEVARGLPTAVTLACADGEIGRSLAEALGSLSFRPYWSADLVGAEVGGAVKNVLAIACGIVAGRGLGDNARAALITRGLAEIVRLGVRLGGRPETLMGLSGLGDLTLTCTSMQSRNTSLGMALGQGRTLDEILAERHSVAEGVATSRAVTDLAARLGVDMPICAAVDTILARGGAIDETIAALMSRPLKAEGA
ncbi:NAD(P)H-dependent glycerol-3-phosphate dehydrogenase [Arenibaculum pallidiluteum]|uniref:NAD(P)H-dependent glycerol-3-phosphate dehydrogenase n=1 Tax=Arenibaculum pallidiluteum TaxID=2812559 RepID=UPI002E2A0636|nr:NAD(P)H-dependent glycerol-3-phosphate dehydrogenase [Arenibaculum pallidiluteum]